MLTRKQNSASVTTCSVFDRSPGRAKRASILSSQFTARLESGEIVTLEKECECLPEIHDGPHWLHMDAYDKGVSQGFLDRLMRDVAENNWRDFPLAQQALAQNELRRLRNKRFEMERRHIVEIFHPEICDGNRGRENRVVKEGSLART